VPTLREELDEWLRIPSVSTGEGEAAELERACGWVCERIEAAGGSAEAVRIDGGHPMAIGELRAARADAPTVLSYGHYDVQAAGPLELWDSAPFEPTGTTMNSWKSTLLSACAPPFRTFIIGTGSTWAASPPR
jgi:acetylornithine deacetylase/succinyl-diaminopimelate desuccinylase-like protein